MSTVPKEGEVVPPTGEEGTVVPPQDQHDTEMTQPVEGQEQPAVDEGGNGGAAGTTSHAKDEQMSSHEGAFKESEQFKEERYDMIGETLTGCVPAIREKYGGPDLSLYPMSQRHLSEVFTAVDHLDSKENLFEMERGGFVYVATHGGVRVKQREPGAPREFFIFDTYVDLAGGRAKEYRDTKKVVLTSIPRYSFDVDPTECECRKDMNAPGIQWQHEQTKRLRETTGKSFNKHAHFKAQLEAFAQGVRPPLAGYNISREFFLRGGLIGTDSGPSSDVPSGETTPTNYTMSASSSAPTTHGPPMVAAAMDGPPASSVTQTAFSMAPPTMQMPPHMTMDNGALVGGMGMPMVPGTGAIPPHSYDHNSNLNGSAHHPNLGPHSHTYHHPMPGSAPTPGRLHPSLQLRLNRSSRDPELPAIGISVGPHRVSWEVADDLARELTMNNGTAHFVSRNEVPASLQEPTTDGDVVLRRMPEREGMDSPYAALQHWRITSAAIEGILSLGGIENGLKLELALALIAAEVKAQQSASESGVGFPKAPPKPKDTFKCTRPETPRGQGDHNGPFWSRGGGRGGGRGGRGGGGYEGSSAPMMGGYPDSGIQWG
ncbi:unnamed protein product [Vitrella brassicaformis CCMP3155]|uniref:Uncharacterized protein n=2 Tax=Vitrella brassicaformis TaxID=1169539 RepID=A0A0G4FSD9_VITBC|nr:unnamed protein product [Vitrella brassicaformis CCMP3155]|mmetsp:Transcript_37276/g.106630  ORF Transcript_37276/g.106630 Transcript_37276/m.106630 type:complete len:600 (+) Transcript_37276:133-1932(+)|eukprot:CEM17605.1 unnamed protein product [Vitrella brassicaformis CCMP3155]